MKAIRSLEQHVDCLMSYDFTHLDDEELTGQLAVVDDRRIWVIAEALRRGFSYDKIHEITKIDKWFIDKLCILTEMETALKTQPLTAELLKEAKRIEFPDNVIARLTGKTEEEIKDMRYTNGITAAYKMVDTCAAEFAAETPYYYSVFGSETTAKKSSSLVPVRSVSARVSSLTSAPYTVPGHLQKKDTRPSSSTTTRKP